MALIVIAAPVLGNNTIDLPVPDTESSSIRCQGDILGIGATTDEVANKCGEPAARFFTRFF